MRSRAAFADAVKAGQLPLRIGCPGRYLDNAKQIPIGVFQYDIIRMRGVSPGVSPRPKMDEPFHFVVLVGCIQIKMKPTSLTRSLGWRLV